jgi:hypothetical protein
LRYEVTHTPPGDDTPTTTVTDAAGVTEFVRQASATGRRVHIRPIADAPKDEDPNPPPRTSYGAG